MKSIFSQLLIAISLCYSLSVHGQFKNKLSAHDLIKYSGKHNSIAADSFPYLFSYSTGTYADLTGTTSLNNGLTWDDPNFAIPVGFNFTLLNYTTDTLLLGGSGDILLAADTANNRNYIIASYVADLVDKASDTLNWEGQPGSLSPISYKLEGNPGSRILKTEWKNASFYNDIADDNNSTDFINFQLWLYETSNDIEIHIGPNSITQPNLVYDPYNGPGVGLAIANLDSANGLWLINNPASPDDTIANASIDIPTLNGSPADGMIYRFSTIKASINETHPIFAINLYPNPAKDQIMLSLNHTGIQQEATIEMADILGKTLYHQDIKLNGVQVSLPIELTDWNAGIYNCTISGKGFKQTKRFAVIK